MAHTAYMLGQVIWGFPQTLAGSAVFLAHARRPHFRFNGAIVTTWRNPKGLSLGPFIFLNGPDAPTCGPSDVDMGLLVHEYGHTVQSLIFGPAYLAVVGLPSFAWSNLPAFARKRQRERRSYYSFWVERSANWLGERVSKLPSIGQPITD